MLNNETGLSSNIDEQMTTLVPSNSSASENTALPEASQNDESQVDDMLLAQSSVVVSPSTNMQSGPSVDLPIWEGELPEGIISLEDTTTEPTQDSLPVGSDVPVETTALPDNVVSLSEKVDSSIDTKTTEPFKFFDSDSLKDNSITEETFWGEAAGETNQAAREAISVVGGMWRGLPRFILESSDLLGGIAVGKELIWDWTKYWAGYARDKITDKLLDIPNKYSKTSTPQPWGDRSNPMDDFYEIVFQKSYPVMAGDKWSKDFEDSIRVSDTVRDRGWIDKAIYWSGGFAGELFVGGPLGLKASARATEKMVKDNVVNELFKEVKNGKLISEIGDETLRAAVRRKTLGHTPGLPKSVVSVRDNMYQLALTSGYQAQDAISYGAAAGLMSTTAYGALNLIFGYDEDTSEKMAHGAGLIGLFTGMRPFKYVASKATTTVSSSIKGTIGRIPFGTLKNVDGTVSKVNVGEIVSRGLSIHHLFKAHKFTLANDTERANFHTLRYAGASRTEAKLLSADTNKANRELFFQNKVKREVIDDALTFMQMLQNLAKKNPEYYTYITEARDRSLAIQRKFKDIFVLDPKQSSRVKEVFAKDLREANSVGGSLSKESVEDIINKFDPDDLNMLLDQIFMVDFLSAIRNMAISQTTMKTLTQKESIDLFTEGWYYNQELRGQVGVIQLALKSLRTVDDIGETSRSFLDHIDKTYSGYKNDAERATTELKEMFLDRLALKADEPTRQYLGALKTMGNTDRYNKDAKPSDSIEESVDNVVAIARRLKTASIETFSVRYEDVYTGEINIPDKATPAEIKKLRDNAPLVELDADVFMKPLDDITAEMNIPVPLGKQGVSPTQASAGGRTLDSFKSGLRLIGLNRKYSAKELALESITEIEKLSGNIFKDMQEVYNSIKTVDSSFFVNNRQVNDLTDKANSEINKVFSNKANFEGPEEYKTALIQAIQKQISEVSSIRAKDSLTFETSTQINTILNQYTQPKITIKAAHAIAKSLFKSARATSDSSKGAQLRELGEIFIDGIDKASTTAKGTPKITETLRAISADYNTQIVQTYKLGAGQAILKHSRSTIGNTNPQSIVQVFKQFYLNNDPKLAATQFKAMFNDKDSLEEATDVLKFSLAKHLEDGGDLKRLGGTGQFTAFADNFESIIGKTNMNELRKAHKAQIASADKTISSDTETAKQNFIDAFKKIDATTTETLKKSIAGVLGGKATDFNPEKLIKLIFSPVGGESIVRRAVRESGDVGNIKAEKDILEATETVGIPKNTSEELLSNAQLPVASEDLLINGKILDVLLEAEPKLADPIKDMIIQHIITESFVTTDHKGLRGVTKTLDLTETLDITKFGNIFKKNIPAMKKVFDQEHLEALNALFEGGVMQAGKNYVVRIMNLAAAPTTQSRASRLFALNRGVVGAPFLITEQTVMTYQRDKASMIKRMVLDMDFAQLAQTMAVDGNITKKNSLLMVQKLKVFYGEKINESDAPALAKAYLEEYNNYSNPEYQNKDIELNLTTEQITNFGWQTFYKLRKYVKKMYGANVLIPMVMITQPSLMSASIMQKPADRDKWGLFNLLGLSKSSEYERNMLKKGADISRTKSSVRIDKEAEKEFKEQLFGKRNAK